MIEDLIRRKPHIYTNKMTLQSIVASVVNSIVIYSNTPQSVIRIPDLSNIASDPVGQSYHWKYALINKISRITTNILNYGPQLLHVIWDLLPSFFVSLAPQTRHVNAIRRHKKEIIKVF